MAMTANTAGFALWLLGATIVVGAGLALLIMCCAYVSDRRHQRKLRRMRMEADIKRDVRTPQTSYHDGLVGPTLKF